MSIIEYGTSCGATSIGKIADYDNISNISNISDSPRYDFDDCCKDFKHVSGFGEFHIVKDKNGITHMALVDTVLEPQVLSESIVGKLIYRHGVQHVRDHIPTAGLFEMYRAFCSK